MPSSTTGKHHQLVCGVNQAQGIIIASCDDRVMWPEAFIPHMLACFEDDNVGGAGPVSGLYIPPKHQNDQVVAPYEAARPRAI